MKIKLLTKAVILLMISFTIGTLSSCSKDDNSPSNKIIKKELTNKDATKKDLTHNEENNKDWGNPIFVFKANVDDVTEELALTYTSYDKVGYNKIDSIDWGDANISKGVNIINTKGVETANHTYKANKEYTVRVYAPSKNYHKFDFSNKKNKTPKIELISITDKQAAAVKFVGKSIDKIDTEFLKGVPELIFAYQMFDGCTSLTDIPSNLLKYNTKITSVSYMFTGNTGLKTIPSDLLKYNTKITDASWMFNGCSNITAIPSGLLKNNTEITTVSYMFGHCTKLKTIAGDLLSSAKITDVSDMFEGCTSLTELPNDLFKGSTGITKVSGVFSGCTNLKTVPTDLIKRISNIQNVVGMFTGCSLLKNDPNFKTILSGDQVSDLFK